MPKLKIIINTHNKKTVNPPKDNITRTCNRIRKHQCVLMEKCLTNNVLYKASITPNKENSKTKIYYGVSETAFKLRYVNHKKHSLTSNTKLIQSYQTNIGTLYQHTKLRTYPGKISEPANHKTKVLKDVFYVPIKSW